MSRIYGPSGISGDHPNLVAFHEARTNPIRAQVNRPNPQQHGFGEPLSKGEEVWIEGLVEVMSYPWSFGVRVRGKLGFYDWRAFDPISEQLGA